MASDEIHNSPCLVGDGSQFGYSRNLWILVKLCAYFAMTGGGPSRVTEILSIYMYNNAFLGRPNLPLANAISLIMVLVSFALIAVTKALENAMAGKKSRP